MFAQAEQRTYDNKAFEAFINLPENANKEFELRDGVIVEMPSPSPLHGLITAKILYFLMAYLAQHDLGYAIGESYDFALAPGVILQPDGALMSYARFPKIPSKQFEIAPDLAVEVVSPSNTATEILYKVEAYLRYGGQVVWVVYPEEQIVCVYRPMEDGSLNLRRLTAQDKLDGGTLLPEFSVSVGDLFPKLEVEQ